jgi:hypothetical protein
MQLVKVAGGARKSFVRCEMLEQVRDLGGRLEYVLARYDRLVHDLAGTEIPSSDFESRVHVVNREIGDVTHRLQELFVLEHEARLAEAYAAFEPVAAKPQEPRTVAGRRRRERGSVIKPFMPAVQAQKASEATGMSRLASAR